MGFSSGRTGRAVPDSIETKDILNHHFMARWRKCNPQNNKCQRDFLKTLLFIRGRSSQAGVDTGDPTPQHFSIKYGELLKGGSTILFAHAWRLPTGHCMAS
jgi:hypothetical protein